MQMKNKASIYFDNAATTPLTDSVIEAMTTVMKDTFGNPSSIHAFGREANKLLRESRQDIAQLLKVPARDIIFTSGGTESNNTAIKGYALANQNKGKHLITTAIEHHSVLHTMAYLEKTFHFEVTYLTPKNGHISAEQVKEALREDTILVSIMAANNETGDLLPIAEIGELLRDHPAAFHVDAVQLMGKRPIYPLELGIDFLSASAHKFHGPKGIGFLFSHSNHFDALLHGGDQEEKRRASTENLIGIIGMVRALKDAYAEMDNNWNKIEELSRQLLSQLEGIPFYLNKNQPSLPHVLNIGFPNHQNGILLTRLDIDNIAISTGSACTAGTVEPSHVLEAFYGQGATQLDESVRISLSDQNSSEEVVQVTDSIKKIIGG